jgi:hypothetical protein
MSTPTKGLRARFLTAPPRPPAAEAMQAVREKTLEVAEFIDLNTPESREKSLAFTHLELAKYYANQAIIVADNAHEGVSE